jgi:hypothetical protein
MKRQLILLFILAPLALMMADFAYVAALSGSGYDLTWNTIDNGGGAIGNGGYTLNGTIGQSDANNSLSSAGYTLVGGFWGISTPQYKIYLPLVLRGS